MNEAKVERGKYRCNLCGRVFARKDIQMDHIEPVIKPGEGFVDWNTYIERLFAPKSGWQVLCRDCHTLKSNSENNQRRSTSQE